MKMKKEVLKQWEKKEEKCTSQKFNLDSEEMQVKRSPQ